MELSELRDRINQIDDEMLELFLRRMDVSEAIAAYKKAHGLPVTNREREREILAEMMAKGGDDMELYVYRLFSTLMDLSKARQSELLSGNTKVGEYVRQMIAKEEEIFPKTGLVACQGVEGGNSQEACDRLFPRGNILYVKTFEAVFQAVQSGLCRYGVVPIENSSNGSVRSVYELMQKYQFSIIRSTRQWIHHTLLVRPGTKLSDIKTIYSHQQALGQCSRFLEKLSGVQVVPCGNTAMAAKMVAEDADGCCAAIASKCCAELYGLSVIAADIAESRENTTRFALFTRAAGEKRVGEHLILRFAGGDRSGALAEALAIIARYGYNMKSLHSRPLKDRPWQYYFYVEAEGSGEEDALLSSLKDCCADVKIAGRFLPDLEIK